MVSESETGKTSYSMLWEKLISQGCALY